MSTSGSSKAIVAALVANVGIAITKFVAFLISGASSMLAESVHSLADSGNQVLLLIGGKRAQREATEEHPFGYGRDRYVYAFIVAIILFTVGGMFAIYEGIHKLQNPEPIERWWIPVGVLVIALILEGFSLRTAVKESNLVRGDQGWVEFIRRAKAPELPVVLLEDAAAQVGLMLALIGVSVAAITGDGVWDGLGTVCIGVLLIIVAIILGVEMKSLLVGEGASRDHVSAIKAAILRSDSIPRIIHLKTLYLGPEELMVAAKITVEHDDTAATVARAIDDAETRIREAVPVARVIYLEPDIYVACHEPVDTSSR